MSEDTKILTGKWTLINKDAMPKNDIDDLMAEHKALAIADVILAMRESVKDFMAQYWVLEQQSNFDITEKLRAIERPPHEGGFDFPFVQILADLRETESLTGHRNHFELPTLFPTVARDEIFSSDFSDQAADYIKMRKQKVWRSASTLKGFRLSNSANTQETPAERISRSTHIPLNILAHNWMKKRPAGEYTMNALMHNIGQLAENFMDPASKDFAEDIINRAAERFVSDLPYMKNHHTFTKFINTHMRNDHERYMSEHIGSTPKVVPLPIKPHYPDYE